MPRISVVVPIPRAEPHLGECLASIARQTFADLEVVLVGDDSTGEGAEIAADFAARDPRFRLVDGPGSGSGRARNAGADAAGGEFLAFVDPADVLPDDACQRLLRSLDATGSDFATGAVHRLTRIGPEAAPIDPRVFGRARRRTHVTRFRALLADRGVAGKLWRRSFWDAHGLRFPEDVDEEIPLVVPAQFRASAVDVVAEPVYHARVRGGEDLSAAQRRLEQRVLLDRIAAVEQVREHLTRHAPRQARRWYDESIVADDLASFLDGLETADDTYRALLLERVNALLDGADDGIYDRLPAIERLRWHLVRRRLVPELLEVLRFQREDLAATPPVRAGRHWYGDYPFRDDPRLRIPERVFRVDDELRLPAFADELSWDGARLRVRGWAYVEGVGAPEEGAQRVSLVALRPGRLRRVRLRTSGVRLRTVSTHRPEVTAASRQPLVDLSWSGFEATLDPRDLRRRGRWREGTWQLHLTVEAGGLRRRVGAFAGDDLRPLHAVEAPVADDARVTARRTRRDGLVVQVRTRWAAVRSARLRDGELELEGEVVGAAPRKLRLGAGGLTREVPVSVRDGRAFAARVALADLVAGAPPDGARVWSLELVGGGRAEPLAIDPEAAEGAWACAGREVALVRTLRGVAALAVRAPAPVVADARWAPDGVLEVRGELPAEGGGPPLGELLLAAPRRMESHAFPLLPDAARPGRFAARLTPTAIASLAGALPLRTGNWRLLARPEGGGEDAAVPVLASRALADALPLHARAGDKPLALVVTRDRRLVVEVGSNLRDDERGPYHQRRLERTAYSARRSAPLRDAVVYSSFAGRQFSDSPRAIFEELVRRDAPLEHLWIVREGMCRVPAGAIALRSGGREHYEALATARYVVTNDHFPSWFTRRPDQVCVQTWHGTPLKRVGFDVSRMRGRIRGFERRWDERAANWQYVVSPNRFSTPILRRAFAVEGEMLETGYPRDDVLARPDRDVLARDLRRRLGVPDGVRTVLYAPTYRDHVVDRRGRYRLDMRLDLDALRRALGPDAVILFRKHHYVLDNPPATADGFVRDVSSYPDGTELLLAADVLITDYSSLMFDFANTGRPMLFFTYDLDVYREQIRGFYLDFTEAAPGPLVQTSGDLAEALADLDAVRAGSAERYAAFRARFCELDDGHATERVVERVFDGAGR